MYRSILYVLNSVPILPLKFLLSLLQHCFGFLFWFFGLNAFETLAPPSGIEPALPGLEGEFLTTGPMGKAPVLLLSEGLEAEPRNYHGSQLRVAWHALLQ